MELFLLLTACSAKCDKATYQAYGCGLTFDRKCAGRKPFSFFFHFHYMHRFFVIADHDSWQCIIAVMVRFQRTCSYMTGYKIVQLNWLTMRSCIFWSVMTPFQPNALLPKLTIQSFLLSSCFCVELWRLLYSFVAADRLDPSFSVSFYVHLLLTYLPRAWYCQVHA